MTLKVAISQVNDGSMYLPIEQTNEAIISNRTTWLKKQDIALEDTTRLHISYDTDDFCRYRIVNELTKGEGMRDGDTIFADALITTQPGHALFLPVADCVATTLYDEEHGVLMLSHLGRHSLEQEGGRKSVEFLVNKFNTRPDSLKVWLGPAPNKEVYPIFKLRNQGMKEAVFTQLQDAGVKIENIHDNPADTATDDRYFSYSEFLKGNKSVEGRFAMVAVMTA
jgi:copper oxidase (laccase) domain-containing protein